jgi:large subunit ribosomal protein L10
MPNQQKINSVSKLTVKLSTAKAVFLTDYTGLNVAQISELRHLVKLAGGEYEVTKNSLLNLAAKQNKIELEPASLTQPTAVIWANSDELSSLKALFGFAKQNELPKFKSGYFQGRVIDADQVQKLASLPSIEILQAQLIGLLNQPITRLVLSLNWNLQKLVFVLQAVATSKGGEKTN